MKFEIIPKTRRIVFHIGDIKGQIDQIDKMDETLEERLDALAWLIKALSNSQGAPINTDANDMRKFLVRVPPGVDTVWLEVMKTPQGGLSPVMGWH